MLAFKFTILILLTKEMVHQSTRCSHHRKIIWWRNIWRYESLYVSQVLRLTKCIQNDCRFVYKKYTIWSRAKKGDNRIISGSILSGSQIPADGWVFWFPNYRYQEGIWVYGMASQALINLAYPYFFLLVDSNKKHNLNQFTVKNVPL
jgi:hypothetical protein